MIREHFEFKETITTILADSPDHIAAAKEGLIAARREVERCIAADPYFQTTFEPYTPSCGGVTVSRMSDAAKMAGVGPMAAVAGAIAWAGVEAMRDAGAGFGVIDNGGDVALVNDREVRIGVHAGSAPLSDRIAFVIPPQKEILGICTSSATVGPSISFGTADAVTVFARNVANADAWATAICNCITPDNHHCLERLSGSGVTGVFALIGEQLIEWGTLPPLVAASVDQRLITAGEPRRRTHR
jgi:uncharacterized protein